MGQIRTLRAEISQLETEQEQARLLIEQYARLFQRRVGPLLTQLTQLRFALAAKQASQSGRRSDAERADAWRVQIPNVPNNVKPSDLSTPGESTGNVDGSDNFTFPTATPESTAAEFTSAESAGAESTAELKKLYRQAVGLAHPDRFANDPVCQPLATAFMSQLNAAYERQDLALVRRLVRDLADGLPFVDALLAETDYAALERLLTRLTERRNERVQTLTELRGQDGYVRMTNGSDLDAHFEILRRELLAQITQADRWLHPNPIGQ